MLRIIVRRAGYLSLPECPSLLRLASRSPDDTVRTTVFARRRKHAFPLFRALCSPSPAGCVATLDSRSACMIEKARARAPPLSCFACSDNGKCDECTNALLKSIFSIFTTIRLNYYFTSAVSSDFSSCDLGASASLSLSLCIARSIYIFKQRGRG